MHMEAYDRSFSTGSHPDGGLSLSSYPLTPEPQLNSLQYSNDCLQPGYATIQYDDNYQYCNHNTMVPESPDQTLPSVDTLSNSYNHRTPLSSISSYSSDSSDPMFSSQSSGLSDIPSISNMSLSSDITSSSMSLFSSDGSSFCNPFSVDSVNKSSGRKQRGRKNGTQSVRTSIVQHQHQDTGVPRRSSAPARDTISSTPLTTQEFFSINSNNTKSGTDSSLVDRKDSFVYDVQLESDNVLLFVPDLVSNKYLTVSTCWLRLLEHFKHKVY